MGVGGPSPNKATDLFIVSQVCSHRPPPHLTASSSPARSGPLSKGEGVRADGGRSCRNWTRGGGVNVHDEGVCPNGGAQVQVLKRRGGRVSVQPGVLAKDRRQGGKKNAEKGRAETSACEVQTVTQSDAVGACLRSPCSCPSSRTCAPRSLTRGLSGVFCGGFVVFLAGGSRRIGRGAPRPWTQMSTL